MSKIIRKHPLTLIEVCIALGLMAIIVTTLFSSLIQTVKVSKSLDTIKSNALNSSLFYNRLLHVFSHAKGNSFKIEKNDEGAISIISFNFENGLDPSLIYSGNTEGSIYIDQNKNLILSIFSKDKTMVQNEILLSNIEGFSLSPTLPFFISLNIKFQEASYREFVFFFSDRPKESEAYLI